MNKKAQMGVATVAGVAAKVGGNPVFQWVMGIGVLIGVLYWLFQTNPAAKAMIIFVSAILFFTLVNVIFIYFWYYVGKWIYYIVVNAKLFVEKAVNWMLVVFE